MKREGRVIDTNGEGATVVLMRHSVCGNCGACQMGKENMNIKIEVLNPPGADIGDRVVVDLETPNVLSAAFIAYGIPLIMLVLGIAGGKFILELLGIIKNAELYSFLIGVFLLAITFLVIRKNDDSFKKSKKYLSMITEIID